jgi:hypothetical protein
MHALDMTVAIVLGLLLLAATLGGLVWLDRGPVGQHGRALKRPPRPEDEAVDQDGDVFPPDVPR